MAVSPNETEVFGMVADIKEEESAEVEWQTIEKLFPSKLPHPMVDKIRTIILGDKYSWGAWDVIKIASVGLIIILKQQQIL